MMKQVGVGLGEITPRIEVKRRWGLWDPPAGPPLGDQKFVHGFINKKLVIFNTIILVPSQMFPNDY